MELFEFYGNQLFIAVFRTAHMLFRIRVRKIETTSHTIFLQDQLSYVPLVYI